MSENIDIIERNNNQFTLFKNPRNEKDDFSCKHDCDFCTAYHAVLVQLPETPLKICKTCLTHLSEQIDKGIQSGFDRNSN